MRPVLGRWIFFFLLCFPIVSFGLNRPEENGDSIKTKKVKVLPLPTFGYEPETKTQAGVVCLFALDFFEDSLTRQSNAKIEADYTWRHQLVLEAEWNYFSLQEKWFSDGQFHISIYPDCYFGIGGNTSLDDKLIFSTNRLKLDFSLYRNLGNQVFVGGGLRHFNFTKLSSDSLNSFNELHDASNLGFKFAMFKDTRNNLLNATKGVYALADVEYNLSQSDYWKFNIDLRKYFENDKGFSLSTRWLNTLTVNTPNFYDYSILGGDEFVRGYFYGRYRDKNLSTLQAEIRTPHIARFGLAAIGGVSSLYNNVNTITNIIRPNYGIGLRFLMDKEDRINLRFDYVKGANDNDGFYISFGESF